MAKTLVSFLLDETGSMQVVKDATISGFNEYIESLRTSDDGKDMCFTLTTFNSEKIETPYDAVELSDVKKMTDDTYQPDNLTPLYDAVGRTIRKADDFLGVSKGFGGKGKQRVIFVILTDGEENHSSEYTRDMVFNLVKEKEGKGWSFVFLGANQDAYVVGQQFGVHFGNIANFDPTAASTGAAFAAAARVTQCCTAGGQSTQLFKDAGVDLDALSKKNVPHVSKSDDDNDDAMPAIKKSGWEKKWGKL